MIAMRKSIILLVLFLSITTARSQFLWQDDGIPLRQSAHIQWTAQSACNSLGETCIVWVDSRMGESKIYAQKFDADGSPMWEEDGVMVGGFALNVYVPPKICASSDDGFLITWGEHYEENPIKTQKLSVNGEVLWDTQGVAACRINYWPFYSEIISDDGGGAYILWRNDSGPQTGLNLQRIQADGSTAPGWSVDGIFVADGFNDEGKCICPDGSGGVIVAWAESEGYPERDIYAQRYDSEGNEMWRPGGELICTMNHLQDSPAICEDGAGGAYIVWHDYRNLNDFNLYMQRIDGDGNQLWTQNGEILCQEAEDQILPQIIYTNDNCAAVTWRDNRNNYEDDFDIFCQRINETGQLLWGAGGVAACTGDYPKTGICLHFDNSNNIFTSWTDMRDGYGSPYVYAQKIDADGQVQWQHSGVLIADNGNSTMPTVNATDDGGAVIGYLNAQVDSTGVYRQKVDSDGNIQFLPNGLPIFVSLSGDVEDNFCLTEFSEEYFLTVWRENRTLGVGGVLYYQIFDVDGNFILPENGIQLCTNMPSGVQIEPQATASPDGNAIVTWEDWRSGHRIYAQKIDEEGNLLWDVEGVKVSPVEQYQEEPLICSDEEGGAYIAFSSFSSIYVQRIASDGRRPWGNYATAVGGGGLYGIVEDGVGGCIVMWYSGMMTDKNIEAARILPTGVLDWPATVCGAHDDQWKASIIPSVQTGAVIAWEDARNGPRDVYAARIDTNGSMPWGPNGVPVSTFESNQQEPILIEDDEGYVICAWRDQRGLGYDTYCQRISPGGEMLFQQDGIAVAEGPSDQDHYEMVPDGEGGVLFVWRDENLGISGNLQAIHLNSEGNIANPVWNPQGNPVCDAYGSKWAPDIVQDGSGGAIAVWMDMRSSTYVWENNGLVDLYMQRINDYVTSAPKQGGEPAATDYYLSPAFPNPFNQRATLDFALPAAAQIKLTVYDILGREVSKLVDGYRSAGNHEVIFDAKDLVSGVYFVRLEAGDFRQARKVLLLK